MTGAQDWIKYMYSPIISPRELSITSVKQKRCWLPGPNSALVCVRTISLIALASVWLRVEFGRVSSVPWVVFEPQEQRFETATCTIANGRKIHSSSDIKALQILKEKKSVLHFFGVQRLKPYLSFCQEPRTMYTDGAIYYVLYCDQVLKYLQEITRKPEKLYCLLWLQLTKL